MTSDALNAFQEKINETKTRYNGLCNEINTKLKECSECLGKIETFHREAESMKTDREEQLSNALNEEKEWEEIKARLAIISTNGKVTLNVGGVPYATTVATLTREKNTFFTALFSKQWTIDRDEKDNSIFIDRNGNLFRYILEYLRTDLVPKDVLKNVPLHRNVLIEAEYFRLHSLMKKSPYFVDGTLLNIMLQKKLNELYGKQDQRWELIYKASRDGFDTNAFHTRCNNQGPAVTIVQSNNGYLFGGCTGVGWTSSGGSYINDTTAFLFTLTNAHNIPPTKYLFKPSSEVGEAKCGEVLEPTFVFGHDLVLAANSNSNNSSYSNFPYGYTDTTGHGNNTFAGSYNFTTTDIEVFKLD